MKTLPLRIIGTLILANFALSSGQGLGAGSGAPALGNTTLVSVASDGTQGISNSVHPSISGNGRYVAFISEATNLVDGDTNNWPDVFVHDRRTGGTERVSVASDGSQANGSSYDPSISSDGRYVAFWSQASNLVSGDTTQWDVFVHDRRSHTTERISEASDGGRANNGSKYPTISADGRYVAFQSWASNLVSGDTNRSGDVFVHDRQTNTTELISVASDATQGNGYSEQASISASGRYVAFSSGANNLVDGDVNVYWDVFVHDRQTGITEIVSLANDGSQGNNASGAGGISADGRFVMFISIASNLVSDDSNNFCRHDPDGEWNLNCPDVFVHDRQTGSTVRISVASDGTEANLGVKGDSSMVADLSDQASMTADGRYVAFESWSDNLVSGDTNGFGDVFLHDYQTGITERIPLATDGNEPDGWSYHPFISADGHYVAFASDATNLVSGDTNNSTDVFMYKRPGINYFMFVPIVQN